MFEYERLRRYNYASCPKRNWISKRMYLKTSMVGRTIETKADLLLASSKSYRVPVPGRSVEWFMLVRGKPFPA